MWKLIHFLVSGGEVVNSNLYADIDTSVLKGILTRPVTGTTTNYVDYMVNSSVVATLTRVRYLFSCFLETRAAIIKYEEFEAKLFEAWTAKFTGGSTMPVVCAGPRDFEDVPTSCHVSEFELFTSWLCVVICRL